MFSFGHYCFNSMFFCIHWTNPILEIKSTTKAHTIQLFPKKLNNSLDYVIKRVVMVKQASKQVNTNYCNSCMIKLQSKMLEVLSGIIREIQIV